MSSEIRAFLDEVHDHWKDNCNMLIIYTTLKANGSLTLEEFQEMGSCSISVKANKTLWAIYYEDPSVSKLEGLSKALRKEKSQSNNQILADKIERFLKQIT